MGEWDVFEELGITPAIVVMDSTGTYEIKALDFPAVAKGAQTVTRTVQIKNNATGSTASHCVLKVRSFWYSYTDYGPIDGKWIQARCSSYGDTNFEDIDNTTGKPIGSTVGNQTIPDGSYADVELRINIPTGADGRIFHVLLEVSYEYS